MFPAAIPFIMLLMLITDDTDVIDELILDSGTV